MKVRGVINNINTITRKYLLLWVLFSGILFSQDPPSEFDFNLLNKVFLIELKFSLYIEVYLLICEVYLL